MHVIYYLSRALDGPEIRHSYVDKLALAAIYVVHRFHHYILLKTTTMIADINPFQYVLSQRIISEKFNKWIVILQELDLDF